MSLADLLGLDFIFFSQITFSFVKIQENFHLFWVHKKRQYIKKNPSFSENEEFVETFGITNKTDAVKYLVNKVQLNP